MSFTLLRPKEIPTIGLPFFIEVFKQTLTELASDLYFPLKYFEQQETVGRRFECKPFYQKFHECRDTLFSFRDRLKTDMTIKELCEFCVLLGEEMPKLREDMIFTLACVPEADKWIGSANIHKNVSGILSTWDNDFLGTWHRAKDILSIYHDK